MIGLATQVFDLDGAIVLNDLRAESDVSSLGRRVSRTATLDGGSVVTDGGYTASDKTLAIVAPVTEAEFDAVAYLVKNYSSIIVTTEYGAYIGAPEELRYTDGNLRLRVLVTEEISG